MKKILLTASFILFISASYSAEVSELKKILLDQQKQLDSLQNKINRMETLHTESLTHYVKNEVDRAFEEKNSNLLQLNANIENLSIKGDLRIRYEAVKKDSGTSRDRFRQRFRLGFIWKTNEDWEIGAGLKTGEVIGNSGAASATSANATYSSGSPFENGGIFLDYAYAKHKFQDYGFIILGQHKNPYHGSPVIFDSDVRLIGLTLGYKSSETPFFSTTGAYKVQTFDGSDNDDANLAIFQLGFEKSGFLTALTYYFYDSASAKDVLGTGANEVNLLSLYAEYSGKIDHFKYKFYGEYSVNFGADNDGLSQVGASVPRPEKENEAFILGAEFNIKKWSLEYSFFHMEADSFFATLTSGSSGSAIGNSSRANNIEGHKFGIGYSFTQNSIIEISYYLTEELVGISGNYGELLQIDLKYKF